MQFTNFKETYDIQRTNMLDDISDWSEQLVRLLQSRVFGSQFEELIKAFLSFDYTPVSRLTEEEREQQLELCSQMRATFSTLADELDIYMNRKKREHEEWSAPLMFKARERVLDCKVKWFKDEKISKAEVKITNDEVRQQFLVDHAKDNAIWCNFIDHIQRAKSLLKNIVSDIDTRSMILMSLRKKQYQ